MTACYSSSPYLFDGLTIMQFHKRRISPQQWPEGPFYWLFFFGVVFEVSQVVLAAGLGWVDLGGLFRGDPYETWDYHLRKLTWLGYHLRMCLATHFQTTNSNPSTNQTLMNEAAVGAWLSLERRLQQWFLGVEFRFTSAGILFLRDEQN